MPDLATPRPPTLPRNLWFFDGFFRDDKGIFGVHYGDPNFMLHIPESRDAPSPTPKNTTARSFKTPSWINPHYPYLLFLPRSNPFRGPIFSCLDVTPHSVPIERVEVVRVENKGIVSEERWGLSQVLIDRWLQLESALHLTLRIMVEFYGGHVADGVWSFQSPCCYGYPTRRSYTRAAAVGAALHSRDAFLPIMAQITMMFILLDVKDSGDWRAALQRASKMPWQWLDDLEASAVGDMETERMGGIIDLTLPKEHNDQLLPRHTRWLLPYLLGRHRVPLYFFFGHSIPPEEPIPKALVDIGLVPDAEEAFHLRSLPGQVAFSPWGTDGAVWTSLRHLDPVMLPPPRPLSPQRPQQRNLFFRSSDYASCRPSAPQDVSLNIADKIFPPVERGSGQREGETIHEFLARRKADNERRMKEESPAAKGRRLQREAIAATGEPPSLHGKHGTQVFIWDMASNFDGIFYIRRQYNRRLAHERWDEFAPTQRIYDGFSNQWDFCEALDPGAEAGFDSGMDDGDNDYDYGGDDDDFGDLGSSNSFFPQVSADAPGREHIQNATGQTLEHVLGEAYGGSGSDADVRDGFIAVVTAEIFAQRYGLLSSSVAPSGAKQMAQNAVRYAVGDRSWAAPDTVRVLLQAIVDSEKLQALPPSLLDLNSPAADLHQKNWPVVVKKLDCHGRLVYVFCPDESDEPFVKLDDAAAVLHCIRSGWRDTREIVRELTRIGAEFFPAWHRSTTRDADDPAWVPPLGVRPAGYNGTQIDYRAYVERRDNFLRSSRGYVALFHGGVVARIARMVIENFEDRVCAIPSETVLDVAVRFANLHEGSLWHEALTPSEIDLICGVYKVATEQKHGDQVKYLSWWPQPGPFYSSALHTGWWNANCETWFQKRLKDIGEGKAPLHTTTEWKSSMRFNGQAPKAAQKNNALAAEFLASCPVVGSF